MKITNWNKLEKDYWENKVHSPSLRVWIDDVDGSYEVHAGEFHAYAPVIHEQYIVNKSIATKLAMDWMRDHI